MDTVETVETVEATIVDKGGTSPVPPSAPVVDGFSGKPSDLQKDLALLAGQTQTQEVPKAEPVTPEPEQPAATATAPETPVPDKFKNPDGSPNTEKIEKSTLHAQAAYEKYADIERQLRQKQADVSKLQSVQPQAQPPQVPVNFPLTPLELGMAQDLINEAAAQGLQLDQRLAVAQAKVMARGLEAKHAAELNVTESLRQRMEDQDRQRELESIAENDAWVLSPEGIETLGKIRQSRPHVNVSKTPWMAAYREHLADQVLSQRLGGTVQTPNPKAPVAKAPPTPIGAAPRAVVQTTAPNVNSMTTEQVTAYVKTLTSEQEKAFWAGRGLKF